MFGRRMEGKEEQPETRLDKYAKYDTSRKCKHKN